MRVASLKSIAVVDDDAVSVRAVPTCERDNAETSATNGRAVGSIEVQTRVSSAAPEIAALAELEAQRYGACRFILVPERGVGADHPFSGEKLAPVLTVYVVPDFSAAIDQVRRLYDYQGKGHSVGVHGASDADLLRLGNELPVARVIADQSHCFAVGGSFDNGLPFSLSMGCGTWGGNSFSENLQLKHFLNITRIVKPIPERIPSEESIFGPYWQRYGR